MSSNPYENFHDDDTGPELQAVPPAAIEGDRGEPTTKAPKKRKKGVLIAIAVIIIFAVLVVGFMGLTFYRVMNKNKAEAAEQVKADQALEMKASTGPDLGAYQDKVAKQLEEERKRREAAALAAKAASEKQASAAAPGSAPAAPAGPPALGSYGTGGQPLEMRNGKPVPTPEEIAAQRRLDNDVLWTGSEKVRGGPGSSSSSSSSVGGAQGGQRGGSNGQMSFEERMAQNPYVNGGASGGSSGGSLMGGSSRGGESIGGMLATETYPDGIAQQRQDLKFLLIHGTTIPCTLIQRIVTNYPGQTSCLINRDVYSADGSVVLVSRGSKVDGERKVSMKNGIAKVFVAWGSIETPDGVRVRIDSLAADQLGSAGLDAWIDNHYPERFGGAILLSFLDDVFQAIADSASNNDGPQFDSSTDNTQDMASIALENSINIPPTGYVNHASETNIIVARDIDFRHIYGVQ